MKLEYLHLTQCPHCKAPVVSESIQTDPDGKISLHVNGQRWEIQVMACGYRLDWVPNFNRAEICMPCRFSAESKEKERRRRAFAVALEDFIRRADIDDAFRERVLYGAARW